MEAPHLRLVRLALTIVAERLIRLLALAMGCFITGWAMWGPGWERVVTLAIFVVFAYALARPQQSEKRDELPPDRPAA